MAVDVADAKSFTFIELGEWPSLISVYTYGRSIQNRQYVEKKKNKKASDIIYYVISKQSVWCVRMEGEVQCTVRRWREKRRK